MRNILLGKMILATLFAFLFISCSNDSNEPQAIPEESTPLLIAASQNSEATSRVGFGNDGAIVYWALEDRITVFGASDKQSFSLKSGWGTSRGVFEGARPTGDGPYNALYPEAKGEVYGDCVLDATGQKQTVNGDMIQLENYTYMTGEVNVVGEGEATGLFSHQMVMMKFELTLPHLITNGEVFKKLIISTNTINKENVIYLKKGLTNSSLDEKSEEQELDIEGIEQDGYTITAYMMMVPFSLVEGDKLILTVETEVATDDREGNSPDDNDEFYRARFYDKIVTIGTGGKTYEAGKKYTATVSLTPVVYDRGSEKGYSYPVKLTNTTTKKSYYVVSPYADWNGVVDIDDAISSMKNEWKLLDSNRTAESTYITIQEILNNTTLNYEGQKTPADVMGFDEVFPIVHTGDYWLYSYSNNRDAFYVMKSNNKKVMGLAGPLDYRCIVRLVRQ